MLKEPYVGAGALDGPSKMLRVRRKDVKKRNLYRRGVEGAAPYSCKTARNPTIHEKIVERICVPDHSDHKKSPQSFYRLWRKFSMISARTR